MSYVFRGIEDSKNKGAEGPELNACCPKFERDFGAPVAIEKLRGLWRRTEEDLAARKVALRTAVGIALKMGVVGDVPDAYAGETRMKALNEIFAACEFNGEFRLQFRAAANSSDGFLLRKTCGGDGAQRMCGRALGRELADAAAQLERPGDRIAFNGKNYVKRPGWESAKVG